MEKHNNLDRCICIGVGDESGRRRAASSGYMADVFRPKQNSVRNKNKMKYSLPCVWHKRPNFYNKLFLPLLALHHGTTTDYMNENEDIKNYTTKMTVLRMDCHDYTHTHTHTACTHIYNTTELIESWSDNSISIFPCLHLRSSTTLFLSNAYSFVLLYTINELEHVAQSYRIQLLKIRAHYMGLVRF